VTPTAANETIAAAARGDAPVPGVAQLQPRSRWLLAMPPSGAPRPSALLSALSTQLPDPSVAPFVHARLKDGFVLVDWSASAGTLNGYRLEYRVNGGSWNELEEWFSPGSQHRAIRPSFGTEFENR